VISGLGEITKVYFGYLSDHLGTRKPVVFTGYLLSALSKFLIPLVSQPMIIGVYLVDRLGKGIRDGPRDAIVATAERKGWAFGLRQAMDTTGAVVGGLAAYYFLTTGRNFASAMFIAAGVGLLALVPLLFVEPPPFERTKKGFLQTIGEVSGSMHRVLAAGAVFGLVMVSPIILIKTSYDQLGSVAVLVYAAYNVIYALSSRYLGALSDTTGRKSLLNASFIFAGMSFLLVYFGGWAVAPGFLLYGVSMGAFHSTSSALVSDMVTEKRGTALGLFRTALGVSIFLGSSAFGLLLDSIGASTYLIGTGVSLASLVAFNALVR
jgi:MFS family permease